MVLIDIEMPERCGLCPCFHAEFPMHCKLIKPPDKDKRIVAPYGSPRPDWCPLKEQEAVEPIRMHHTEHKQTDNYRCQKCGNDLYFEQRFCDACGRPVKWTDD